MIINNGDLSLISFEILGAFKGKYIFAALIIKEFAVRIIPVQAFCSRLGIDRVHPSLRSLLTKVRCENIRS